jgi:hypothetical protein
MFPSGIFVVEHDLHSTTPTKKDNDNKPTGTGTADHKAITPISSTANGTEDSKATGPANDNKAPTAIPKPLPVPQPPSSDSVDAGQGPKPEPVARPPTIPLSFKLIWATMMAPGNPST